MGVRLVSEAMGGAVEMEKLHEFSWVLHLSELKFQLQSNLIPIGLIRKGIYCHRAVLFKVTLTYLPHRRIRSSFHLNFHIQSCVFTSFQCLADSIGVSSTLVRGEYNRAWNEVLIFSKSPTNSGRYSQPSHFIVDLMHQPGSLLPTNSPAAVQYQTI